MTQTDAARPRRWYYGWNILAVLVVVEIAAMGMPLSAFSLFLHDWSVDLHAPISTLSLAMSILATVGAITGTFIGGFADRYPARWLLGGGMLGLAAFALCISFVTDIWQFVALYGLVLPIVTGLTTLIVVSPLLARWFVRRIGLAMGIAVFGTGLAGVVLPPLIAAALPVFGWRAIWRISAVIFALVVTPLILWVVRDRPTAREGFDYVGGESAAQAHRNHHSSIMEILRRRNFWLLALMYLPIASVYMGVLYNLAPIAESRSLGGPTAGVLVSVLSFAHIVSTPLLGLLSDKVGIRIPFLLLCIFVAAGSALAAVGGGLPSLTVACALIGVGGAVWTPLAAATAKEFGSASAGQAFGLMMAFSPISGAAAFILARMKEATGSYTQGLFAFVVILGIAVVATLAMRESRPVISPLADPATT